MRKDTELCVITVLLLLAFITFLYAEGNGSICSATTSNCKMALIIISTVEGEDSNEIGKSMGFHDYLLSEGFMESDIEYLTFEKIQTSDCISNVSNIEKGFNFLIDDEESDKEVVIYISDHAQGDSNSTFFAFEDGGISASQVDSWIEEMVYSEITVIINGNRSGLSMGFLGHSERTVIASMDEDQNFLTDQFNITRSLEDPTADIDQDNEVSYEEAYWREVEILENSGQEPLLFS